MSHEYKDLWSHGSNMQQFFDMNNINFHQHNDRLHVYQGTECHFIRTQLRGAYRPYYMQQTNILKSYAQRKHLDKIYIKLSAAATDETSVFQAMSCGNSGKSYVKR